MGGDSTDWEEVALGERLLSAIRWPFDDFRPYFFGRKSLGHAVLATRRWNHPAWRLSAIVSLSTAHEAGMRPSPDSDYPLGWESVAVISARRRAIAFRLAA
jgi:hypothetical protein